jgi:hypothetical protein
MECAHTNLENEGHYTREYPKGVWMLVTTYTCRGCHMHRIRRQELTLSQNWIEEDFYHNGPSNRLTSTGVRAGAGA